MKFMEPSQEGQERLPGSRQCRLGPEWWAGGSRGGKATETDWVKQREVVCMKDFRWQRTNVPTAERAGVRGRSSQILFTESSHSHVALCCHAVTAYQWFPTYKQYLHLKGFCTHVINSWNRSHYPDLIGEAQRCDFAKITYWGMR